MSWSGTTGSQTFSRTDGTRTGSTTWQLADAAGVDIIASDHDTHDQDMADGINSCLKKDGGNTATADLPMGGFKHTNVGAAAGPLNYTRFDDHVAQKGIWVPTVGGTANTITLTTGFNITSYVAGQRFTFIPTAINTSTATINVDGNGAKNVYTSAGQALTSGEIVTNIMCTVVYDGTQFVLQSSAATPVAMSVGVVMAWPMTAIPSGWLECNGSAVSRTTYASLFAVIGTSYGTGDGSTTFNLPNYQDYFLRGFDASGTEASSRTDRGDGTTGASVGTKQASAFLRHNHTASVTDPGHTHTVSNGTKGSNATVGIQDGGSFTGLNVATNITIAPATTGVTVSVANTAANDSTSETRPKNITVKWIILAQPTVTYALGTGAGSFNVNGIAEPHIEVYADDGSTQANITATTYTLNGGGTFHANYARGTRASPSAAQAGDITGGIGSRPYHSGGAFAVSSPTSIHWVASENHTNTARGSYLRILTTPQGSASRQERLIVADTGTVWAHDTGTYDPKVTTQTQPLGASNGGQFLASGTTNNATFVSIGYGTSAGFRSGASAGTPASPSATLVDTLVGFIGAHVFDGTNWSSGSKALIALKTAEQSTSIAQGTYVTIETTPVGSTTRGERLRIDGNGFATITGSIGLGAPVTKTADFTLASTENYIINNKSGSACVATLPAASSWTGRRVVMKTIQAQAINSASSNVVPVAGGAAGTAIVSGTAGKWAELVSDGTDWIVMATG